MCVCFFSLHLLSACSSTDNEIQKIFAVKFLKAQAGKIKENKAM